MLRRVIIAKTIFLKIQTCKLKYEYLLYIVTKPLQHCPNISVRMHVAQDVMEQSWANYKTLWKKVINVLSFLFKLQVMIKTLISRYNSAFF